MLASFSQPLADALWARTSPVLLPGAGRRGTRHLPPGPRSSHLEVLAGETTAEDLLAGAEEGLYFAEASRGHLDALSGEFVLYLPFGQRFRRGRLQEAVGPCSLRGRVSDLLTRVVAVGDASRPAGVAAGYSGRRSHPRSGVGPLVLFAWPAVPCCLRAPAHEGTR